MQTSLAGYMLHELQGAQYSSLIGPWLGPHSQPAHEHAAGHQQGSQRQKPAAAGTAAARAATDGADADMQSVCSSSVLWHGSELSERLDADSLLDILSQVSKELVIEFKGGTQPLPVAH